MTNLLSQHGDMMVRLCQARYGQPAVPRSSQRSRRDGRLRVGIVSEFFWHCYPVWKGLISGWVSGLDCKAFEVIGFHTQRDDSDDPRMAYVAFDTVIGGQPTIDDYLRAIRAKAPDILIFPDDPLGTVGHQL